MTDTRDDLREIRAQRKRAEVREALMDMAAMLFVLGVLTVIFGMA